MPRFAVCDSFIIIAIIILILMSNNAKPCLLPMPRPRALNQRGQLKILQSRVNNVATATTTTKTNTTPDKRKLCQPTVQQSNQPPPPRPATQPFSLLPLTLPPLLLPPLLTDIIFAVCHCSDYVFYCPYFASLALIRPVLAPLSLCVCVSVYRTEAWQLDI